jgi:hypothetical protein
MILCNKKEQLEKMNKNILKNIKENEKIYDKKINESEKKLEITRNRLKLLQDENDLLNQEMAELEKLIQLNAEENNIKAQVKIEESKFIKDSNNVSQTRNEILQDLKIIKSEEEKINAQKTDNQLIIEKKDEESEEEESSEKQKNSEGLETCQDVEIPDHKNQDEIDINNDNNCCFDNLQPENISNVVLNNTEI